MLNQEELDKLLEEEAGGQESPPPPSEKAEAKDQIETSSSDGILSQDDLDDLFDGDNAAAEAKPASDKTESAGEDNMDWSDAFAEAAAGGDSAAEKAVKEGVVGAGREEPTKPLASAPNFDDFSAKPSDDDEVGQKPNLDFILELPLDISVELGRSKIQVKQLLQLCQGSVIELNKMAGEPAEMFVNHKLMAKGEVVVVNEKFGIRLIEIVSHADRIESLGAH